MTNKKLVYAFLISVVLTMTLFSATESFIFKQDANTTLEIPVFESDVSKCLTCTCTVSIEYPDGINIVRNLATGIQDNYAIININASMTSQVGVYKADVHCSNGADNGAATFEYEVNKSGLITNVTEAYFLIFIGSILFLLIIGCIYQTTKIKNYGWGVGYLSMAYILLIMFLFIIYQITSYYVNTITILVDFTYFLWFFVLICFFPFIIGCGLYLLSKLTREKAVKKYIDMGHSEDDAHKMSRRK